MCLSVAAMSFVVTIHGNEKVFNQDLPRQLKTLSLTSLSPGIDTQGFVIKVIMAFFMEFTHLYVNLSFRLRLKNIQLSF